MLKKTVSQSFSQKRMGRTIHESKTEHMKSLKVLGYFTTCMSNSIVCVLCLTQY